MSPECKSNFILSYVRYFYNIYYTYTIIIQVFAPRGCLKKLTLWMVGKCQ